MLAVLCAVLAVSAAWDLDPPEANTSYGVVRGCWKTSAKGRRFANFQGVPYAAPPVGVLRFKAPQPPVRWTGEWDASKPSARCLQYDGWNKEFMGDEDCLYLNVYSPNLTPERPLPTLIFIHGGAFMYGTGAIYGPEKLIDFDMVVVTLNYRLGALGFLSTGDLVVPGNMGLKDQSFALHWIKNNIHAFGGDPERITLTGNSAGGASVHYHYLSPLSRGTFARGIAFSGSAFAPWTHAREPVRNAKRLAALLHCPTSSSAEMVECLTNLPGDLIVRAQANMHSWVVHMFTVFTPTIEPVHDGSFLSRYPYEVSRSGDIYKVPLVATCTSAEGLYPAGLYQNKQYAGVLENLEANWEHLASEIFEYNDTLPVIRRPEVAAAIKNRYFHDRPISQETFPELVQALSDRLFVADVGRLVQEHALHSGQPTYLYRFNYRGSVSLSNLMSKTENDYGVSHSDDMLHVFNVDLKYTKPDDLKVTDLLLQTIYNYAATGVPKPPNADWKPVSPGSPVLDFLEISSPTNVQMKTNSDFGNKTFWDSLGFIENENYLAAGPFAGSQCASD